MSTAEQTETAPVEPVWEPVDLADQALAYDILRAAVAGYLATRKTPLRVTPRQRARAGGVVIRSALMADGAIVLSLEPGFPGGRSGVVYRERK